MPTPAAKTTDFTTIRPASSSSISWISSMDTDSSAPPDSPLSSLSFSSNYDPMSLNVTSLWPSPTSSITATATTASESGPGIQTASSATADLDLVERRLFWSKVAGIGMVFLSGTLIGASVVFTRRSQKRAIGLSGKPSWHSFYWWIGASLMTFGEICNFCAYGLVPAINITPLGAWSVVVSAVLSHIFLKERLDYTGKIGCALCVIGSIIIAVHAPQTFSTRTVRSFFAQASHPVFLSYSSLMLLITVALIFYLGPRFGTAYPLVYVFTGSIFGSFLVLSAQGFGAALAHSVVNWSNDNQFLLWPFYAIFVFEIVMIVCQLYYLNKGVAAFSSTVVAPLYYITFTTVTFLSTIFFFRGFPVDSAVTGITIWFGFFVIAGGVTLLFRLTLDTMIGPVVQPSGPAPEMQFRVQRPRADSVAPLISPVELVASENVGSLVRLQNPSALAGRLPPPPPVPVSVTPATPTPTTPTTPTSISSRLRGLLGSGPASAGPASTTGLYGYSPVSRGAAAALSIPRSRDVESLDPRFSITSPLESNMGTLRSNLDFPVDNGGGGGAGGVVDRIVVINGDSGSRSTSDWRNSSFLREEEEALYSRMLAASARRGSNAGITETPWWMTMPDTSGSAESKSPEESMDRRKAWKSQGWAVSLGIGNDERATVTAVAGSKRNSAGSSTVEMPKRALASSRRGSAGSSLADVAVRPGASQTFPSQASPLPRSGVLRQKPGDLEWANLQSTSRAFGLA